MISAKRSWCCSARYCITLGKFVARPGQAFGRPGLWDTPAVTRRDAGQIPTGYESAKGTNPRMRCELPQSAGSEQVRRIQPFHDSRIPLLRSGTCYHAPAPRWKSRKANDLPDRLP
jgi:hypothetical protein